MAAKNTAQTIAAECIGARVRILNRYATRIYDDMLRPHGIKFSQMNILTVVTVDGPIQAVEVARTLSLEKSTLSRNLKILEANGWIERNDQLLRMTRPGRLLYKKAAPDWRRAQKQITAMLGESTTAAIRRAAGRIRETEPRT